MKIIKRFENFDTDETRGTVAEEPKYNPVKSLNAKNYVDLILNKGGGAEVTEMCKEIGVEMPKDDSGLEKLREDAIRYFTENPERIKSLDQPIKKYPYAGTDGVVRTNNIGGSSFANSTHVGESVSEEHPESMKIDLTDDEMRLFGTETLLLKLIKNNKISLHDKAVWFNRNDEHTKQILDIFFEIDDTPKINESLITTIALSLIAGYTLLKFLGRIISIHFKNQGTNKLLYSLKLMSAAITSSSDKKLVKVISVSEYSDRYFITCKETLFGQIPNIVIRKDEQTILYDNKYKILLNNKQYQEFLRLAKFNMDDDRKIEFDVTKK